MRLILLVGSALLVGFVTVGPVYAGQSKVDICHRNGQGTFQLITIAQPAYAAHIAHGDKAPEDFFRDADGDGFGSAEDVVTACDAPEGYVEDETDCDDTNTEVYPGADEVEGNDIIEDCDIQLRFTCPCYNRVVEQARWIEGMGRGERCEVSAAGVRVAAVVGSGEGIRAAFAAFAADSAGNLFPRCSIYYEPTNTLFELAITDGQALACMQSLRAIAESIGLHCQ
jgi:hypothetical protein